MLFGFPAKNFQPLPRLLNRQPITRMIPVLNHVSYDRLNALAFMANPFVSKE